MARHRYNVGTMSTPTIVNVGYRSTNFWVVSAGTSRLLVDLGWPGSMGQMLAALRRMDVPLAELRYGLATHYHIDHAGLGQELKQAGVPLLVVDLQLPAIPRMKQWTKPQDNYVDITPDGNVVIACAESRALLGEIGIAGEILPTPGHSDDSVSLLLDSGAVFTGDLTLPAFAVPEDAGRRGELASVKRKRGSGGLPGHGPAWYLAAQL